MNTKKITKVYLVLIIILLYQVWYLTELPLQNKKIEQQIQAIAEMEIPSEKLVYFEGSYYIEKRQLERLDKNITGTDLMELHDAENQLNACFHLSGDLTNLYEMDERLVTKLLYGKSVRKNTGALKNRTVYLVGNKNKTKVEQAKRAIETKSGVPELATGLYYGLTIIEFGWVSSLLFKKDNEDTVESTVQWDEK